MATLENKETTVIMKPGREKSIRNRHPWVFSGGIKEVKGDYQPGDIVSVFDARQRFLGKGFINPASQIRVRLLTFQDEEIDADFFRNRLQQALESRKALLPPKTNAYRLIHSDGDGLSGLTVDRYDQWLVAQFHSAGIEQQKPLIIELLSELTKAKGILERSDMKSRRADGLETDNQSLAGEVPPTTEILENKLRFQVDLEKGQKTGFFLDQRENRQLIGNLSAGKRLLNCFSYSGGFSVYAAKQGAQTTSLDISKEAIALAKENFTLNKLPADDHQFISANAFDWLREIPEQYDVIVLDPPAFVKAKQQVNKGARGYKDINRLAISQVASGGLVLTCSCSSYISWDLFRKIIFSAAQEAERTVQIIARPGQPFDHPINIYHPEGEYLKTFLLRVW